MQKSGTYLRHFSLLSLCLAGEREEKSDCWGRWGNKSFSLALWKEKLSFSPSCLGGGHLQARLRRKAEGKMLGHPLYLLSVGGGRRKEVGGKGHAVSSLTDLLEGQDSFLEEMQALPGLGRRRRLNSCHFPHTRKEEEGRAEERLQLPVMGGGTFLFACLMT